MRAFEQRSDKSLVLFFVHGAIDIISTIAAGTSLVVARLKPCGIEVNRFLVNDWCNGIEKRQRIFTGKLMNGRRQSWRGEGAGRDNHVVPILGRETFNFFALNLNIGVSANPAGYLFGESNPIDSQCTAGGNFVCVSRRHDDRIATPHFCMKNTNRIRLSVIGTERIGANQFRKAIGRMGFRCLMGAHFVKDNVSASLRRLPRGLRASQPGTDNMDRLNLCHNAVSNGDALWGKP